MSTTTGFLQKTSAQLLNIAFLRLFAEITVDRAIRNYSPHVTV